MISDYEPLRILLLSYYDDCYFYAEESHFKSTTIKLPSLFELDEHVPSDDFEG
jgi:hypothetical protein